MLIKYKLLPIFLTYLFLYCSCTSENKKIDDSENWSYENNVVIFPYFETSENFSPAELSNDDLPKIDNILNKFIREYNDEQLLKYNEYITKFNIDKYHFILRDVEYYNRQYMCALNNKGIKEVFVLCFPKNTKNTNWRENFVLEKTINYFFLFINITNNDYYYTVTYVNGCS